MNTMKKTFLTVGIVLTAAEFLNAGDGAQFAFGQGWRLSIGPALNAGYRTRFKGDGRAALGRMPSAVPKTSAQSSASAYARATGRTSDGVIRFDNGGWINPVDAANAEGSRPRGETWNLNIPDAARAISGGYLVGRNAFADYAGSSEEIRPYAASENTMSPGVSIEVARNLYHNEEHGFGVDIAFDFNWFFRSDLLNGQGEVARRTDSVREGYYESSIDVSDLGGDYALNPDGSFGRGTYDGPGPVVNVNSMNVREISSVKSGFSSCRYSVNGDYNEYETALLVRPYYDVFSWLRVYGTLGVGFSYMHLRYSMTATCNGRRMFSEGGNYGEWSIYGLAGLGALAHYDRYSLGFDFMSRLWTSDLDLSTRYINGSVSRGQWMFRLMAGLDF